MKWPFAPILEEPNESEWLKHFPRGIGNSAFSSLPWQQIMAHEVGSDWHLRILYTQPFESKRSMPVFVRYNRWRRYEIAVLPVAYFVTPWESDGLPSEDIQAILRAIASMRTTTFSWWLPPWSGFNSTTLEMTGLRDLLSQIPTETYLMELNEPAEEYLATKVSKTHARYVRASMKRGMEIINHPSPELVDEYFALYQRVRQEQNWTDKPFSREFFHSVATTLSEGGQLLLMRYEDRVVGGGVFLYDRHAVHYFQGTMDRSVKNVHPHSVLYAEALKRAAERNLHYINVGGINEGNEGLVNFKTSWGAKPCSITYLRLRCTLSKAVKRAFRSLL